MISLAWVAKDKRNHLANAIKPPTWFCVCISPVEAILAWFSTRTKVTNRKQVVFIMLLPPHHAWYVKCWTISIPQPLCQNCPDSIYSHQAIVVDSCYFTRRQTCREIQSILSKSNYLCRSRFLSAMKTTSNPEVQGKYLFSSACTAGSNTDDRQGRVWCLLWPSLLPLVLPADADHPAVVGELNLFKTKKIKIKYKLATVSRSLF